MRNHTLTICLCISLAARSILAQEKTAEERFVVTVRARPDVKAQTLIELAALLEERQFEVKRTIRLRDLLRSEYGNSTGPMRALFASENGRLDVIKAGTTVTLPAAPEFQVKVKTVVPNDEKVSKYAHLWMGFSGKQTIRDIAKRSELSTAQVKRQTGGRIVLPYLSPFSSHEIRPEYEGRIEWVRAALAKLSKRDPALRAEVTPAFRLTPHYLATGGSCALGSPAEALCGGDSVRKYAMKEPTIVAILDSGVPRNDARFRYWRSKKDKRDDIDIDDVIGVNFVNGGGFPEDDVDVDPWISHGTHVAGIASCRLAASDYLKDINDRLGVMVLKVARSDATVDPFSICEAVRYARNHGAHVVNLSLQGPDSGVVRDYIDLVKDKILFVAAAGNDPDDHGKNLDEAKTAVYPAAFSKMFPNVISVAAYDSNHDIACFSHYGGKSIDIAAPGTDIESTVVIIGNTKTGKRSGTSQATPYVTFAAALLHARGLDNPAKIRQRLMYSADFHPKLAGRVRSDGYLNIDKALAYDDDIIRLVNETLPLYGRLQVPPETLDVPELGKVPFAAIRKIIVGYKPGTTKLFLDGPGLPLTVVAAIPIPPLTILVNGKTRKISMAQILEVIPRTGS